MKQKKCKACSQPFTPQKPLQACCGLSCEVLRKKQVKSKPKEKKKVQTLPALKKYAAKRFQLLRRLECADADGYGTCPTSRKRIHWSEGDGGHCVPRGISETLFDHRNVYLQSSYDNAWEMGRLSKIEAFFDYIAELHGPEVVEELKEKERAKRTVKWTREDLVSMIARFDARIEKELERVSGVDPHKTKMKFHSDQELYEAVKSGAQD